MKPLSGALSLALTLLFAASVESRSSQGLCEPIVDIQLSVEEAVRIHPGETTPWTIDLVTVTHTSTRTRTCGITTSDPADAYLPAQSILIPSQCEPKAIVQIGVEYTEHVRPDATTAWKTDVITVTRTTTREPDLEGHPEFSSAGLEGQPMPMPPGIVSTTAGQTTSQEPEPTDDESGNDDPSDGDDEDDQFGDQSSGDEDEDQGNPEEESYKWFPDIPMVPTGFFVVDGEEYFIPKDKDGGEQMLFRQDGTTFTASPGKLIFDGKEILIPARIETEVEVEVIPGFNVTFKPRPPPPPPPEWNPFKAIGDAFNAVFKLAETVVKHVGDFGGKIFQMAINTALMTALDAAAAAAGDGAIEMSELTTDGRMLLHLTDKALDTAAKLIDQGDKALNQLAKAAGSLGKVEGILSIIKHGSAHAIVNLLRSVRLTLRYGLSGRNKALILALRTLTEKSKTLTGMGAAGGIAATILEFEKWSVAEVDDEANIKPDGPKRIDDDSKRERHYHVWFWPTENLIEFEATVMAIDGGIGLRSNTEDVKGARFNPCYLTKLSKATAELLMYTPAVHITMPQRIFGEVDDPLPGIRMPVVPGGKAQARVTSNVFDDPLVKQQAKGIFRRDPDIVTGSNVRNFLRLLSSPTRPWPPEDLYTFDRSGLGRDTWIVILDTGFELDINELDPQPGDARQVYTYVVPNEKGAKRLSEIDQDLVARGWHHAPEDLTDWAGWDEDPEEWSGHGTSVAAIAGGKLTGVAPLANLYLIKTGNPILDGVNNWPSNFEAYEHSGGLQALAHIRELLEKGILPPNKTIINMSMGAVEIRATKIWGKKRYAEFVEGWREMMVILDKYNVTLVAAAGNDGLNRRSNLENSIPNTFILPDTMHLNVGAVNFMGQMSHMTTRPTRKVEMTVWAHGTEVSTTTRAGLVRWADGTSFAAPVVAGLGAYLLSTSPMSDLIGPGKLTVRDMIVKSAYQRCPVEQNQVQWLGKWGFWPPSIIPKRVLVAYNLAHGPQQDYSCQTSEPQGAEASLRRRQTDGEPVCTAQIPELDFPFPTATVSATDMAALLTTTSSTTSTATTSYLTASTLRLPPRSPTGVPDIYSHGCALPLLGREECMETLRCDDPEWSFACMPTEDKPDGECKCIKYEGCDSGAWVCDEVVWCTPDKETACKDDVCQCVPKQTSCAKRYKKHCRDEIDCGKTHLFAVCRKTEDYVDGACLCEESKECSVDEEGLIAEDNCIENVWCREGSHAECVRLGDAGEGRCICANGTSPGIST
ncbi:hypothetical protein ACHAQH_005242 [Verticillium albo-atrum]